ncbi:hypothetical protein ACWD7F_36995 [Streptomyces sp. NPDC005122]
MTFTILAADPQTGELGVASFSFGLRMKAAQPSGRQFAAGLFKAFAPPVDEYRLPTR